MYNAGHDYLRQFLSAYWLRTEIALWRSIDVNAVKPFEFELNHIEFHGHTEWLIK